MRFNLSNKSSFNDFLNFTKQFENEIEFVHDPSSLSIGMAMPRNEEKPLIKMSQGLLDLTNTKQAQGIYLHEVGHLANDFGLPAKIPAGISPQLFKHYSEFRSDAYAGSTGW